MLLEVACAAACLGGGSMGWAVRGRSSSVFGRSVYRGNSGRPAIALTFDDGPSESTPRLLELLARHHAPATFFFCGANVRRLPEVARQVAQAGHEIGNHADSHARLYLRSSAFIRAEMLRAQRTIVETTGVAPVLFRAPYGARWFGMRQAQRELGLTGVMWTGIGLDWKLPSGRIAERLFGYARNGAILCLHDGRGAQPQPDIEPMLEAVRHLLPELAARGFGFETVSQILSS
jgi:peptidoglycan/xylan/chitin deacetylase (PgdA/CDA1 family)